MPFTQKTAHSCKPRGSTLTLPSAKHSSTWFFACLMATAALVGVTSSGAQSPPQGNPQKPIILPEANRPLDANDLMKMREQQTKQQNYAAANTERKRQLAEDSALLLKLATDLKAEVDKTTTDMLSLTVIRKADEIERLAHNVKEKMKLTVGGN
jgi:hypothetical protein